MKRQYMKPAMRVVKIQQRHYMLMASPDGYNNKTVGTYRDSSDKITDADLDDII